MSSERFILEPYKGVKTRFKCHQCGSPRSFVRFIDTQTNEYVAENVGRCGKESCGYFYGSSQYFADVRNGKEKSKPISIKQEPEKPLSFLPDSIVEESVKLASKSNLFKFIQSRSNFQYAKSVFDAYKVGITSNSETVFFYIDIKKRVRSGQIIKYNEDGHRCKKSNPSSVPYRMKLDGRFEQCFFGEHLLSSLIGSEPVGLIESPKSALIASIWRYKGVRIWLSYTTQNNLSRRLLDPVKELLKDRKVYIAHDFHFKDRMINGTMKARKHKTQTGVGKTKTVFGRNGSVDTGFIPKSSLLDSYGLDYEFLDSPLGSLDDTKNDIADYLVLTSPFDKVFTKCDSCNETKPKVWIEDGSCLSCRLKEPLVGLEKEAITDYYCDQNEKVNKIVKLFDLQIEPERSWQILMPLLQNINYSEPKKISYEDSFQWAKEELGEYIDKQEFCDMVEAFVGVNESLKIIEVIGDNEVFVIESK